MKLSFSDIFQNIETHKKIIKGGLLLLLAMEIFIYIGAANHAGKETWVNIYDSSGEKIYETPGTGLTKYEKLLFERAFGPLEQYRVQTETRYEKFPFRAWLAIAVSAPIGMTLLILYLLSAYLTFLSAEETESYDPDRKNGTFQESGDRFQQWFNWRRISIFHMGGLLIVGMTAVWLLPNYIAEAAGGLLDMVVEFKWFFFAVCIFLASLVVWIVYLRYRMSRKMMDRQMDLEKFRMEKQMMVEMKKIQVMALPDSTARVYDEPDENGNGDRPRTTLGDPFRAPPRDRETDRADDIRAYPEKRNAGDFLKKKSGDS